MYLATKSRFFLPIRCKSTFFKNVQTCKVLLKACANDHAANNLGMQRNTCIKSNNVFLFKYWLIALISGSVKFATFFLYYVSEVAQFVGEFLH